MSNAHGDTARANIRIAIAAMERELGEPPGATAIPSGVRAAWRDVVKALDLGPPTQMRDCPVCNSPCIRNATRCAACWASFEALALLPETAAGAQS